MVHESINILILLCMIAGPKLCVWKNYVVQIFLCVYVVYSYMSLRGKHNSIIMDIHQHMLSFSAKFFTS